jgi:hypothetical protein
VEAVLVEEVLNVFDIVLRWVVSGEALLVSYLKKIISIFFRCGKNGGIIIYSIPTVTTTDANERTNSSKSFSVKSLRLPRGALGVIRSSSSIFAGIEDVCS